MSALPHSTDEHPEHGAHHGTMKQLVIGFVLALILTAIPFWLVIGKVLTNSTLLGLILLGLGAVQIVVHMIYFLHMNTKSEGGWSLLALIFTAVLLLIMMCGSLWVMYHLNHNMMPGMMELNMETKPESIPSMPRQ